MLRSGKKIELQTALIKSKGCLLIAPVIDLGGISIRCDRTTPREIKDFFAKFGADVGRVKYENEMLARVRGEFELPLEAIEEFIANNAELVRVQNAGTDTIIESKVITTAIEQNLANLAEPNRYLLGKHLLAFKHRVSIGSTTEDMMFHTLEHNLNGRMVTGKDILIASDKQNIGASMTYADVPLGFMSEMYAKKRLSLANTITAVENAIVEAGETLKIIAEEQISLGINPKIDWVNNPHPETNGVKIAKRVTPRV